MISFHLLFDVAFYFLRYSSVLSTHLICHVQRDTSVLAMTRLSQHIHRGLIYYISISASSRAASSILIVSGGAIKLIAFHRLLCHSPSVRVFIIYYYYYSRIWPLHRHRLLSLTTHLTTNTLCTLLIVALENTFFSLPAGSPYRTHASIISAPGLGTWPVRRLRPVGQGFHACVPKQRTVHYNQCTPLRCCLSGRPDQAEGQAHRGACHTRSQKQSFSGNLAMSTPGETYSNVSYF